MSKQYWVNVPVDCHITVLVDAENEDEAKEKALESDFEITLTSEGDKVCLEHFDPIPRVHQGNVCYLSQWEIEAEEC